MQPPAEQAPPPITARTIRLLEEEVLSPADLYVLALERLGSQCDGCKAQLPSRPPDQVMPAIEGELQVLEALAREGSLPKALRRVAEYEDWRLKRPELAAALVARARAALPGDPLLSGRWATIAEAAARLGDSPLHRERQAQALAYQANALRVTSDFLGSARKYAEARALVKDTGFSSPTVGADMDLLESSLARDLGDLSRCEQLVRRSVTVQLSVGSADDNTLRAMIALSIPLLERGETPAAREILESTLPHLRDLSLRLLSLVNLCLCYVREEDYQRAFRELTRIRLESRDHSPDFFTSCRIRWVEARIASGLGAEEEALELFRGLFEEFLDRRAPYDGLLVALDWIRVASRLERSEDLSYVAQHLGELSRQADDLHEPAQEALRLLREALAQESFTEALYWQLESFFWQAAGRPELRIGM